MGGDICPFLFGNLSGNWTGAKRLFAHKPGRGGPSGVSADSPWGGGICPFLFGNLSGNWTGAKRLFARKQTYWRCFAEAPAGKRQIKAPGRWRTKKRGSAGAPPKRTKRDPRVPQDEKVLTRFSQVGAPPYRVRLSVHKQTLPIGTDHLQSAPEFQMWIKIFRAPNTADRICYSVFKKEGLPSFFIYYYTRFSREHKRLRAFFSVKFFRRAENGVISREIHFAAPSSARKKAYMQLSEFRP